MCVCVWVRARTLRTLRSRLRPNYLLYQVSSPQGSPPERAPPLSQLPCLRVKGVIVRESQPGRCWVPLCPADTPADAPVDDLQRMLADKAARRVADEQTRMRIAAEVDVAMDNGVHINPLLRQVYGERSSEAQGQEREE